MKSHARSSVPAARSKSLMNQDDVTWTRVLDRTGAQPRELYRIQYSDRDGEISEREIELQKIGSRSGTVYLGVLHAGKFKTLRADGVLAVIQLSVGHEPSIRSYPTYASALPNFPISNAVYRMPTVKGTRTWKVDLNAYTCSCPEKRDRSAMGYAPGQLGFVCPHMARAILDHLPMNMHGQAGWTLELVSMLADPRKVHLDNLS